MSWVIKGFPFQECNRSLFNNLNDIRDQIFGTTVVQKFNQGTHRKHGGYMFPGPFLGTFLGKQKGTKT